MLNEIINSTVPGFNISMGHAERDVTVNMRLHYHDEFEIIMMNRGARRCLVPNGDFLIDTGDIAFINSRTPHGFSDTAAPISEEVFQFGNQLIPSDYILSKNKNLNIFLNNDRQPFFLFKRGTEEGEEMRRYLAEAAKVYAERERGYEMYVSGYISLVLGVMYKHGLLGRYVYDGSAMEKILPAVEYIDSNYMYAITLSDICKKINLNEAYFCRLFKKATGGTPVSYLNFVRILSSEELLGKTDNPISDIALNVGFENISYFNRIFKRLKLCTPTEYRRYKYKKGV